MGGAKVVDSISFDGLFNRPLSLGKVMDAETGRVIDGFQNVRNADNESLAIMGNQFRLMQPESFLDIIGESLTGLPFKIAFAASLNNERSYMVGVEILGLSEFSIGNEEHRQFQVYGYAVDGSVSRFTSPLLERIFCSNQFSMIVAKACGRAKNTEGGAAKYKRIIDQIGELEKIQRGYIEAVEILGNSAVGTDTARRFIAGMIATGDKLSKQGQNLTEDIYGRFTNGIGTHGRTMADLFNAFTERYTHESNKREVNKFGASLVGKAADMKRAAFAALKAPDKFNAIVGKGRIIIENTAL